MTRAGELSVQIRDWKISNSFQVYNEKLVFLKLLTIDKYNIITSLWIHVLFSFGVFSYLICFLINCFCYLWEIRTLSYFSPYHLISQYPVIIWFCELVFTVTIILILRIISIILSSSSEYLHSTSTPFYSSLSCLWALSHLS